MRWHAMNIIDVRDDGWLVKCIPLAKMSKFINPITTSGGDLDTAKYSKVGVIGASRQFPRNPCNPRGPLAMELN